MYGRTGQAFTHYHVDFKVHATMKTVLSLHDLTSIEPNNKLTVFESSNNVVIDEQIYGMKQNLKGQSYLNINYTLVDWTQFNVDVAPLGYSVTTPFIAGNSISSIAVIALSAVDLIVDVMDCNCP